MKRLDSFLERKYAVGQGQESHRKIDEQTLFYVFGKVIAEEYGAKGTENIQARFYKDKKLFVAARTSLWANELALDRAEIIAKLNQVLGQEAIQEIKVESTYR